MVSLGLLGCTKIIEHIKSSFLDLQKGNYKHQPSFLYTLLLDSIMFCLLLGVTSATCRVLDFHEARWLCLFITAFITIMTMMTQHQSTNQARFQSSKVIVTLLMFVVDILFLLVHGCHHQAPRLVDRCKLHPLKARG